MRFSKIPFFKLFIALSLGILLSVFFAFQLPLYIIVLAFVIVFLVHVYAHVKRWLIPYFGVIFLVFILFAGIFRGNLYKQKARSTIAIDKESFIIGEIAKSPKIYEHYIRTNLKILAINQKNQFLKGEGKLLLSIEKDSLSLTLKKGDCIQFKPNYKTIDNLNNPEMFNYKRYLFFHLISQQTFLKSKEWTKVYIEGSWFNLNRLSDLRDYLLQQYQYYGINGDELSVLSALTLGYKNDLDYKIQQSYASTGAIHVLAVSGLHVGIVFVIISYFLRFLGKKTLARIVRFVISVLLIWFFAFLTGGSPSVLRASLMFSFIALGQVLKRTGSIYNSIFGSAFFLLLYNPFLLFDLSFQLSYSAVISIVFFQPRIFKLISFKNPVLKWVWGLTSVSISAQIGTVPITIFYFHQFPNYFILSNFVVIPLATLVIWISLLFFMSLHFEPVAQLIANVLQHIIYYQNILIQEIEHLPYSLSKDLYIDKIQLGLLISILLSLMLLMTANKRFRYGIVMGSFMLLFLMYSDYRIYRQYEQKKLIVYNIKGFTAINLIDGSDNILISSFKEQSKQKDFYLKNNWLSLGLEKEAHIRTSQLNRRYALTNILKTQHANFFLKEEFIQFLDKRILVIRNKSLLSKYKKQALNTDYIIIGGNTRIDISELDLYFKAKQIIIDSSNSAYNLQFWKIQKALHPSKEIYIIPEEGAFVRTLSPVKI